MAMACGALAIACASTSIAMVHSTSVLAAGMFADHGARTQMQAQARTQAQPWWAGFEDASMSRLMAAAQDSDEPGVAAAYIALKVKTLELVYLENTRAAVARQAALIAGTTRLHDDFAKQLAQRQRAADATIGELDAQRTSYLSYLAARCHLSQAALDTLLADALQSKSLPRFAAEVPREPPVAVTLDRNDRVADALQNLRMHSDIANTAYVRVADARTDFEASKRRRDRGEISEVQLMEDFQGLLLDLHVLAAANGELAMAWVVFIGNAQSMRNDTAVDAMTSPQTTQLPFLHKVSRKLRNP
jgi:hypothetical protein